MATRQRSSIGNGNRVRGISSRPIIGRPTPTSAQKSGMRADARRVSMFHTLLHILPIFRVHSRLTGISTAPTGE